MLSSCSRRWQKSESDRKCFRQRGRRPRNVEQSPAMLAFVAVVVAIVYVNSNAGQANAEPLGLRNSEFRFSPGKRGGGSSSGVGSSTSPSSSSSSLADLLYNGDNTFRSDPYPKFRFRNKRDLTRSVLSSRLPEYYGFRANPSGSGSGSGSSSGSSSTSDLTRALRSEDLGSLSDAMDVLGPQLDRLKKSGADEFHTTAIVDDNDFVQIRPAREGRRYLLWRKITG